MSLKPLWTCSRCQASMHEACWDPYIQKGDEEIFATHFYGQNRNFDAMSEALRQLHRCPTCRAELRYEGTGWNILKRLPPKRTPSLQIRIQLAKESVQGEEETMDIIRRALSELQAANKEDEQGLRKVAKRQEKDLAKARARLAELELTALLRSRASSAPAKRKKRKRNA